MKRVIALACMAALGACDKTGDENYKAVQEFNLKQPTNPQVFNFASNQTGVQALPPAVSHFCFLTRVSGDFQGGGESVRLRIDDKAAGGPRWTLVGNAGSAGGVSAQAVCVPKGKFATKIDGGDAMAAKTVTPETGFNVGDCGQTSNALHFGDAAHRGFYLSGMTGRWSGGGEAFGLNRVPAAPNGITLRGQSCQGSGVWAMAYNLRPDKTPVKFFSPNGPTTDGAAATFTAAVQNDTPPSVWDKLSSGDFGFNPKGWVDFGKPVVMAPVQNAVCALTAISGKFRGGSEFAQVAVEGDHWVLRVESKQEGGFLAASARCVMRDQRG